MKRVPMPPRRSRLRAGKPLKRYKSMRLVSNKKHLSRRGNRAVRLAVFARDGYTCVVFAARDRLIAEYGYDPSACFGELTFSHRRKEGQGGAYRDDNGTTMCAHHNQQLEADARLADIAHQSGWVVRRGDSEWEQLGE